MASSKPVSAVEVVVARRSVVAGTGAEAAVTAVGGVARSAGAVDAGGAVTPLVGVVGVPQPTSSARTKQLSKAQRVIRTPMLDVQSRSDMYIITHEILPSKVQL